MRPLEASKIIAAAVLHVLFTICSINTFTTCRQQMLQLIFFLSFTAALFFKKIILDPFFLLRFYFPGTMISLREAKCDLISLKADRSQQGHGKLKALLS